MDPEFPLAHACMADSYEHKLMHTQAIAEIQRAIDLSGGSPPYFVVLASFYAHAGKRDQALRILKQLKVRSKREFVPPQVFMYIYAQLGDKDRAMAYLEKAYEDRYDVITGLKVEPLLQPLRSDPRFQELVQRVNFQQ
jgi:tetratricopeptide (TPR) repeat protein